MITYKSKIGDSLIIPISIIVGGTGTIMAYEKLWIGLAFIFLVIAFIVHMFSTTYYIIDNKILKIRCVSFFKSININTIKEIKKTRNPISSPATSFDRMIISYNKLETIIISSREKENFINHLTSINPGIKITL